MAASAPQTPSSSLDDDGVRIIRTAASPLIGWGLGGLLLIAAGAAWYTLRPAAQSVRPVSVASNGVAAAPTNPGQRSVNHSEAPPPAMVETPAPTAAATERITPSSADWRTGDANDLATYASPGDPEPTGAELIQALRASGETAGIAAFNPPGTSPPLLGLAVPEDYVLPEGYVRHHQVTDDGQPLEAILMYAPDAVLRDAAGRIIPIPEDRVVRPELAPPGLPIRQIEIPPPAD
ncbi:MAG: hypothetical protein U1F26_14925 [Lysobacterales bacterium]